MANKISAENMMSSSNCYLSAVDDHVWVKGKPGLNE
jgi:hypothetical protein